MNPVNFTVPPQSAFDGFLNLMFFIIMFSIIIVGSLKMVEIFEGETRMKKCNFHTENFRCKLSRNHKGDHKDGKWAMFNPDQYAKIMKEKPE